jgi:MFS family permease
MSLFSFLRPSPIPRAPDASGRAVWLAMFGRFTDELLGGIPTVLMPTISARLGVGYAAIGLLHLVLTSVAALVEPVNGLLIDVWSRHRLMAWGALGTGLSLVVIGVAPDFVWLAAGFGIYGLASGPLAHTADVVLVDAHPESASRIVARSTLLDTVGALMGPLFVTVGLWAGVDWRWIVAGVGLWGPVYAVLILGTRFPAPAAREDRRLFAEFGANLRAVLANRESMAWLLFLFAHELTEAPLPLRTVWLADEVGMSQSLVGVYVAFELAAMFVGVALLDRWLTRSSARGVLRIALGSLLLLYPLWFALPGAGAKFLIGGPLNLLGGVIWPVGRGESLASAPGRAGTLTAVSSLTGLVPATLAVGLLAEAIGPTLAMSSTHVLGVGLMLAIILGMPRGGEARVE